MSSLLIITQQNEIPQSLLAQLGREGVDCSVTSFHEEIREEINRKSPDAILLEIGSELTEAKTRDLIGELKRERPRLVIALIIPEEMLAGFDSRLEFDDFILNPGDEKELADRVLELYHSPEKRASLASRAQEFYRKCQWQVMKHEYLKVYDECTKSKLASKVGEKGVAK